MWLYSTQSITIDKGDLEIAVGPMDEELIQFNITDYPNFMRYKQIKNLRTAIGIINKALRINKIKRGDIENFDRKKIFKMSEFIAMESASYLKFLRVLLRDIIPRDQSRTFEEDIIYLQRKYQRIKKKQRLTPKELVDFIKYKSQSLQNLIIRFGILLQGIYGVRYVSLSYATFPFTAKDIMEIKLRNERIFDRNFAINYFPNFYEKIKEIAMVNLQNYEINTIESSNLINGNKVRFYWKGSRFEEFPLNDIIKNEAEKVRKLRILQIFYETKRIFNKDNGLEEPKTIKYIKNYRKWLLPFYFPYSHMHYIRYLRKIFNKRVSYHDIRRAFATLLHEKGFDIVEIKEALRHKDIKTTQLYIGKNPRLEEEIQKTILDALK